MLLFLNGQKVLIAVAWKAANVSQWECLAAPNTTALTRKLPAHSLARENSRQSAGKLITVYQINSAFWMRMTKRSSNTIKLTVKIL